MDLTTNYLGLTLKSPLMNGAAPIVDDLGVVRALEDAGAGAVVMHSLFEEQIAGERLASIYHMEMYADSYAEALSYFPKAEEFYLGRDEYLEHVAKVKAAVKIPVIASLNGSTIGGWTEHARLIEQAGADALELNLYFLAADPGESGEEVEQRMLEIIRTVKGSVRIPVAVKLSPFFTSLSHFATRLDALDVDGLVLFNRFYQPDIDIEMLEVTPALKLSDPAELLLRLRWLAILSCQTRASLACGGGVHDGTGAIKAIMAGASAVQVCSALLLHGAKWLSKVRDDMSGWMEESGYASVQQMRGCMNLSRCPDPQAFERANYMRILQGWRGPGRNPDQTPD